MTRITPSRLLFLALASMVGTTPVPASPPGGNDGEIQYNDSGAFAGADGLTYDATSDETSALVLNGALYPHLFASSGDGSGSNPWVLPESTWNSLLARGIPLRLARGIYETPDDATIDLGDESAILCEPGAAFRFPATLSGSFSSMFTVPSDAVSVVIDGCGFQPGITVPEDGESGGLGPSYIEIGSDGATSQASVRVVRNTFGPGRNKDAGFPKGDQINVISGTRGLEITGNTFDRSQICVRLSKGHATAQYAHDSARINDNVFEFGSASGDLWWAVNLGGDSAIGTPARFDNLQIRGNAFRSSHSAINVSMGGRGLSIADNVANSDIVDLLVQMLMPSGITIEQVAIVGNVCTDDGTSSVTNNCMIVVRNTAEFVVAANVLRSAESAIALIGSSHGVVANNVVDSRSSTGLYCFSASSSTDVTFTGNRAIDCGSAAFSISNSSSLGFFGNMMTETPNGTIAIGLTGGASCIDCAAAYNLATGGDISGGWIDSSSAFLLDTANTATSDPAPFDIGNTLQLSNGTATFSLSIPAGLSEDAGWVLEHRPGPHYVWASSPAGTPSWKEAAFGLGDSMDTLPNSHSGDYNNGAAAANRDFGTYASKGAGTGGPYTHEWEFPASGTKSGVVEIWHRLNRSLCLTGSPSQAIAVSTNGGSSYSTIDESEVYANGAGWTNTSIYIQNQDLSQLRVQAQFDPDNLGGGPSTFCRAEIAVIVFDEGDRNVRFSSAGRSLLLANASGLPSAALTAIDLGSTDSPTLDFVDGQTTPERFSVQKVDDSLVFLDTVGESFATFRPDEPTTLRGRTVLTSAGAASHGVLLWGDAGSGSTFDTGDEVCADAGLSCTATTEFGQPMSGCSGTSFTGTFIALCY